MMSHSGDTQRVNNWPSSRALSIFCIVNVESGLLLGTKFRTLTHRSHVTPIHTIRPIKRVSKTPNQMNWDARKALQWVLYFSNNTNTTIIRTRISHSPHRNTQHNGFQMLFLTFFFLASRLVKESFSHCLVSGHITNYTTINDLFAFSMST